MFSIGAPWSHQGVFRLAPCIMCRYLAKGSLREASSSAEGAAVKLGLNQGTNNVTEEQTKVEESSSEVLPKSLNNVSTQKPFNVRRGSVVAAAFASLRKDKVKTARSKLPNLYDQIQNAESVESLLVIADAPTISRPYALKIVSILADWTANKRVKLSEFDADPRFHRLCRLLGKKQGSSDNGAGVGDLGTVLGITGDDKAAKLVAGMNLDQMIRVMSSLTQKKRRSTPLLRSLAFNIGKQREKLNIKQIADLLFSITMLNFPDQVLLDRINVDLLECLPENKKPAVVGSIFRSLGILRYRDTELLDSLTDWTVKNATVCRPQDLVSSLLTLASVYYHPSNSEEFFKIILSHLTPEDVSSPSTWLDVVWCLLILERQKVEHMASVLSPKFIDSLSLMQDSTNGGTSVALKLKLLNINGAAECAMGKYEGPLLEDNSFVKTVPLSRSREKETLVRCVLDSLSNLLPSAVYLRTNIDTGMGFLLDGECVLDAKCNPIPVDGPDLEKKATDRQTSSSGTRIAVMVWDYHDMCRSSGEPNGINVLYKRLLERKGYRVLAIPHTEFSPRDKLLARVQYIERQLKSLAKKS